MDAVQTFKTYFELGIPAYVDVGFEEDDEPAVLCVECTTRTVKIRQPVPIAAIRDAKTAEGLAWVYAKLFRDRLHQEAENDCGTRDDA